MRRVFFFVRTIGITMYFDFDPHITDFHGNNYEQIIVQTSVISCALHTRLLIYYLMLGTSFFLGLLYHVVYTNELALLSLSYDSI